MFSNSHIIAIFNFVVCFVLGWQVISYDSDSQPGAGARTPASELKGGGGGSPAGVTRYQPVPSALLYFTNTQEQNQRAGYPPELTFSEPLKMSMAEFEETLSSKKRRLTITCGGRPMPPEDAKRLILAAPSVASPNYLEFDGRRVIHHMYKRNSIDEKAKPLVDDIDSTPVTTSYVVEYSENSLTHFKVSPKGWRNFIFEVATIIDTNELVLINRGDKVCNDGSKVLSILLDSPNL